MSSLKHKLNELEKLVKEIKDEIGDSPISSDQSSDEEDVKVTEEKSEKPTQLHTKHHIPIKTIPTQGKPTSSGRARSRSRSPLQETKERPKVSAPSQQVQSNIVKTINEFDSRGNLRIFKCVTDKFGIERKAFLRFISAEQLNE